MGFLDQIGGMLQQYAGVTSPSQAPGSVEQDYNQMVQNAPPSVVASGVADAMRSPHTPDFSQIIGNVFSQADSSQRAGILSQLLGSAGPAIFGSVLGSAAAGMFQHGTPTITPEVAQKISPEQASQIAAEAERRDPSVIDRVSQVFGEHPHLFKALGEAAMFAVLAKVAQANHIGPY